MFKREDAFLLYEAHCQRQMSEADDWDSAMSLIEDFFNDDKSTEMLSSVEESVKSMHADATLAPPKLQVSPEQLPRSSLARKTCSTWSYRSQNAEIDTGNVMPRVSSRKTSRDLQNAEIDTGNVMPRVSSRKPSCEHDCSEATSVPKASSRSDSSEASRFDCERPWSKEAIGRSRSSSEPPSTTSTKANHASERKARKDPPFLTVDSHDVIHGPHPHGEYPHRWRTDFVQDPEKEARSRIRYNRALSEFRAKLQKSSFDPSADERSVARELATQANALAILDPVEDARGCHVPFFQVKCCVMDKFEASMNTSREMINHDHIMEESFSGSQIFDRALSERSLRAPGSGLHLSHNVGDEWSAQHDAESHSLQAHHGLGVGSLPHPRDRVLIGAFPKDTESYDDMQLRGGYTTESSVAARYQDMPSYHSSYSSPSSSQDAFLRSNVEDTAAASCDGSSMAGGKLRTTMI
eukprot:gnl/MRDRNA2_/MRDRNA2_16149_c0_seq1.p1 gnl/MRDRNA2_/MRDRNA2_16149_c0~~gnl/MRDRNA2_/MRDRNA2_16149_c0_seq1.p1  ORF type:complete len:466 (+),score=70.12 gnl/MRDRNA2_/MRDRNA2_16149_c0_seq1:22-1419(+)